MNMMNVVQQPLDGPGRGKVGLKLREVLSLSPHLVYEVPGHGQAQLQVNESLAWTSSASNMTKFSLSKSRGIRGQEGRYKNMQGARARAAWQTEDGMTKSRPGRKYSSSSSHRY